MRGYIVFVLILTFLLMMAAMAHGQRKRSWVYKGCYTRSCVTAYLNTLPDDAQVEVTYDSDAAVDAYDIWVQR